MSEGLIYKPLIEDMEWSYSRISLFNDCKYAWFLKYINKCPDESKFYASFGSFMHKLLEMYYKNILTKDEMKLKFLTDFSKYVNGRRPKASILQSYIQNGIEYLDSFTPFDYKMIDVEKEIHFDIDGYKFVGVIDYLGELNGDIYIIDNKSRKLRQRSSGSKKNANDATIDMMLRQLYLYSAGIKKEYGKFPKYLCFNCFRNGVFIKEPFNIDKYYEAVEWAKNSIEDIKNVEDFTPNLDYFYCTQLCGFEKECCYYEMR